MCLRVEAFYDQNPIPTTCAICGRGTGGRFSPPVRYILKDDEEQIGDVCERCAYGSTDLWKVALIDYAIRLETRAAVLRSLANRVVDAEPAQEGIAEDIVRRHTWLSGQRRPPLPPYRFDG